MSISPRVQDFQNKMMQEGGRDASQNSFNKKFGDSAYNTLNAKHPSLTEFIVTFKVIESNKEESSGLGTFILQMGDDVCYIPVVLSGGSIISCEMVYYKTEDELAPLIDAEVKHIANANLIRGPRIPGKGDIRIEKTDQLFRNMFRPPTSSSIALTASTEGYSVAELPNKYKEVLAKHFSSDPDLLSKVAEFYDVEQLASKLAQTQEDVAEAGEKETICQNIIKLSDLTKEAAKALSVEDKEEVLQRGYVLKLAESEKAPIVAPLGSLPVDMVTTLDLVEKTNNNRLYGKGNILRQDGASIVQEPCIVAGNLILTKGGRVSADKVVLSAFRDGITALDLVEFGATSIADVKMPTMVKNEYNDGMQVVKAAREYDKQYCIFYPTKGGDFKELYDSLANEKAAHKTHGREPYYYVPNNPRWNTTTRKNIEGSYFLGPIGFVKNINKGYIKGNNRDEQFVPEDSLIVITPRNNNTFITSMPYLYNLIINTNVKLGIKKDGPDINLVNKTMKKTAKFNCEADLVEHLAVNYHLTKEGIDTLLDSKEVVLLEKIAYNGIPMGGPQQAYGQGPYAPQQQQSMMSPEQSQGMGAQEEDPQVNQELINGMANIGDPEMFETGMLASVAGDEDIKSNLVDMTPQFNKTVTDLGKTILIFSLNKKEVEEYYGVEDYNSLLNNVRKVFTLLGTITHDLKKYINMR